MGQFSEIKELLHIDLRVDFRKNASVLASFIYIISAIFVVFLSFRASINPNTWNSLFWIIVIFSALNMVVQGFLKIEPARFFYYYTICSAQAFIIAKITYNSILILLSSLFGFLIYVLFLGSQIQDYGQFFLMLVLGSIGNAVLFTLVTAIAYKANRNVTLAAILGLPLVLPILILVIAGTKVSIDDLGWSVFNKYLISMLALDLALIGLSYLLFPYLWKE
ncbi:MAG: hypothetical protein MRY83_16145 [Flavobacteriales bacterium]|nr:hypothetical protein [Flavobacteriales bacterium]